MARSKAPSAAEQARLLYRRSLANRNNERMLDAPTVPGVISGDPDGLLPAELLDSPLEVEIPAWDNRAPENYSDRVLLEWARKDSLTFLALGIVTVDGPVDDSFFPMKMQIAVDDFLEGPLQLRYQVRGWTDEISVSQITPITLDTTPPYGNDSPEVMDLPDVPDTDDYLDEHDGALVSAIPAYEGERPGDRAAVFMLKDVPEDPDALEPLFVISLEDSREVRFPRALLQQLGDGDWYPIYVLIDKAGNISRLSDYQVVRVALGALPAPIQSPQLPLAHDGLIDRQDAFAGVMVEIPRFDHWRSTDRVLVNWGGTALDPVPLGPVPVFPFAVAVPWSVMKSEYGGPDSETLAVSYQVLRGSLAFPSTPLATEAVVNFHMIGPANPDEPNPANPVLALAEVRGEKSNQANVLTEADHGLSAVARIALYDPVAAGQRITLYWNGERDVLAEHDTDGSEKPGDVIDLTIPWALIERHGNHAQLPVHYTIEDPFGFNPQHSHATPVRVEVITVRLEAATYPDLQTTSGGAELLNCNALFSPEPGVHGFRVHVPADPRYLKEGMEVTLEWYAIGGVSGMPIPGTEKTDYITLTADQQANGIDWFVEPYDQCIQPTYGGPQDQFGWGVVHYTAIVGGASVRSETLQEMVAMGVPEGGTCRNVGK